MLFIGNNPCAHMQSNPFHKIVLHIRYTCSFRDGKNMWNKSVTQLALVREKHIQTDKHHFFGFEKNIF